MNKAENISGNSLCIPPQNSHVSTERINKICPDERKKNRFVHMSIQSIFVSQGKADLFFDDRVERRSQTVPHTSLK